MRRLAVLFALSAALAGCEVKFHAGPGGPNPGGPTNAGADPAENAAEEALKTDGGWVKRDSSLPGNPVVEATFGHEKGNDGDIKHLLAFKQLKKAKLGCQKFTGAGIKQLAALPKLEALDVGFSPGLGDDAVKEIVTLKGLKRLKVLTTKVGDAGLRELAAGLPQLQELDICQIREWTDAGIVEGVAKMKNLRKLSIGNTNIGDRGFEALATLPKLEELAMIGTQITDKGMLAIGRFPALRKLDIGMHNVTDDAAREIAKIKTLKELRLYNTRVTDKGRKAIQDALPGITFKS